MIRIPTEQPLLGRIPFVCKYTRRFNGMDLDLFAIGHIDKPVMVTWLLPLAMTMSESFPVK